MSTTMVMEWWMVCATAGFIASGFSPVRNCTSAYKSFNSVSSISMHLTYNDIMPKYQTQSSVHTSCMACHFIQNHSFSFQAQTPAATRERTLHHRITLIHQFVYSQGSVYVLSTTETSGYCLKNENTEFTSANAAIFGWFGMSCCTHTSRHFSYWAKHAHYACALRIVFCPRGTPPEDEKQDKHQKHSKQRPAYFLRVFGHIWLSFLRCAPRWLIFILIE